MLRNFSLMLRDPDRQPTVPRKFPRDGDPGNGFSIFVQYLPTHHNIRTICPDLPELPAFLDPTQRSPAEATATWYMLVYAASPAFQGDENRIVRVIDLTKRPSVGCTWNGVRRSGDKMESLPSRKSSRCCTRCAVHQQLPAKLPGEPDRGPRGAWTIR
ncbi:hypothetical protein FDECE_12466 [Fusarium decemcellulare]|nr:hypothetical protein FDECE_12466 [Fusarium decemcellulare]